MSRKPIIVTGTHRSGTTWAGKMLSLSDDIVYVHEPFNIDIAWSKMGLRVDKCFANIDDLEDPEGFYEAYDRLVHFKHVAQLPDCYRWHFAFRIRAKAYLTNLGHRLSNRRPLMKDPFALVAAAKLSERFDMHVVCMIRNPLAFCSSLIKWNWSFPFDHFLNQSGLMADYLEVHRAEMEKFVAKEQPILDQGIFLWNLLHGVIRSHQEHYPDWVFARHEDLVADPVQRFQEIYERLGIPFSESVRSGVIESGNARKQGDVNAPRYQARDPQAVLNSWKSRLSEEDARRIMRETEEHRIHFYPELVV